MKRHTFCMVILSAMALVGMAWAGQDKAEPRLRLELDLVDGSHVIGVPGIESVPVQTPYAKMDVALKQILTIKIAEDHEMASLDLRNGDKLKGVISLEPIKIETIFGKVTIGIEHIRRLDVALESGRLQDVLRRGLVQYYSFDKDEGGRIADKSGQGHDGTVHGAHWTPNGKVGGAYDFDGKRDSIEMGSSRLFRTTGQMSACAWVRLRGKVAILLSNYHGGSTYGGQFFFEYVAETGGLDLLCGQSSSAGFRYRTRCVEIPAGEWHHLAFSYDESRGNGRKVNFYVDGEEAAIGTIDGEGNGGPILDIDENLRIMAHRDTPTGTLSDGLVDEVMMFDRALTGQEIKQIYDAQK